MLCSTTSHVKFLCNRTRMVIYMFCGDAAIYTLLVWILAETQIQCKNPKAPLVCKPVRHAELTRV